VRTGFPGILARTIPVPSYFVQDTSITSLHHASDPFENLLSFQRCFILFRGRYTILIRVPGWRNFINRTPSGLCFICGFRRRCDSVRGHRDFFVSYSELEYTSICLDYAIRTINPVIQFGIAAYFTHFAPKLNPGVW
jgi:hypothetical protein